LDEQKKREMAKFNKKPAGHNTTAVDFGGMRRKLKIVPNDR